MKTPPTLTSRTRRAVAMSCSCTGAKSPWTPAFATTAVGTPWRDASSLTASATASWSVTSNLAEPVAEQAEPVASRPRA
jgi:hypothetical protein